jgi:hypothetical protein
MGFAGLNSLVGDFLLFILFACFVVRLFNIVAILRHSPKLATAVAGGTMVGERGRERSL